MIADSVYRAYLKGTHVGFMRKINCSYDRTLYILCKHFFKHLHIYLFSLVAAFDEQHESGALEHLRVDGCIFKLCHQNKFYGNMLVNNSS